MKNGQAQAHPAEAAEIKLPEILTDPQSVPESRAFYSSNPASVEGIDERPDGIDDIEIAVILHHTNGHKSSVNENALLNAVRFMRVREGRVLEGEEPSFDFAAAAKGVRWIRQNVRDKDIHRSAVIIDKSLRPGGPGPEPKRCDQAVITKPAPSPGKSKRAREREEQIRQREESQRQHEGEREAEFAGLLHWKENLPVEIVESFFEHQEMLDSSVAPNGKLLITENKGLDQAVETLIRRIMVEPRVLIDEIQGEFFLSEYLATHDMPITKALYAHYNKFFAEWFMSATYDGPESIKQAFQAWSGIFVNLSEEYKQSLGYGDETREPELMASNLDSPETRMHALGTDILFRSFEKVAETDMAAFIDLVHETTNMAIDNGDEFMRTNFMHIISTIMSKSMPAAISLINAPILESLDETSKLKAVDFMMALRQLPTYRQPMGYIKGESKEFRKHDKKLTNLIRRQGLSRHPRQNSALYEITAGPYMEAVQAGALADSLYQKMLKGYLPQDA